MLRRNIQLLTLTLLSAAAFAAPRAEAVEIIDQFTNAPDLFGNPALFQTGGTIGEVAGNLVVTDTYEPGVSATAVWTSSNINLSVDGDPTDNYFEIFVTNLVGTTWGAVLTVGDGGTPVASPFQAIGFNQQAYVFPYSAFGFIDFSSIDTITLALFNASDSGDLISVDYLTAVPEPGSAALLTLGLLGLAAGSPRRRVAA